MSNFSYVTGMMYVNEFEELYRRVLKQAEIYKTFLEDMGMGADGVTVDIQSIDGDTYGDGPEGYVEKWLVEFSWSHEPGIQVGVREYAEIQMMRLVEVSTGDEMFREYDPDEFNGLYGDLLERRGLTFDEAYELFVMGYVTFDPYEEIKSRVDREIR